MRYYYATEKTRTFLKGTNKRVFLYGGFLGYNNFGDIIQLKQAIKYHQEQTKLNVVVVLHLSALESNTHVKELERWLDCDTLLFISDVRCDASDAGLDAVTAIKPGGILHIYGGGFLNKYWGKAIIDKIADIVADISIDEYVFSGQQIEEGVIENLNVLFRQKPPLAFGVRDKESLSWMQERSIYNDVKFSFDDVTEIFQAWRDSHKLSLKDRAIGAIRPPRILLHINMSSYATTNKKKLVKRLRKVRRDYPQHRMMLAQSYNDTRTSLKDTLQSVVQLENEFPYTEYGVVNLAQMSLEIKPGQNKYPNLSNLMHMTDIAIVSSYHTAMLALFFGVPAFLMSENEFYGQKQRALHLESDFEKFIKEPKSRTISRFEAELLERKAWINHLTNVLSECKIKSSPEKILITTSNNNASKLQKLTYRSTN